MEIITMFDRWSSAQKRVPQLPDGTSGRSIWNAAQQTPLRQCLAGASRSFGRRRECRETLEAVTSAERACLHLWDVPVKFLASHLGLRAINLNRRGGCAWFFEVEVIRQHRRSGVDDGGRGDWSSSSSCTSRWPVP